MTKYKTTCEGARSEGAHNKGQANGQRRERSWQRHLHHPTTLRFCNTRTSSVTSKRRCKREVERKNRERERGREKERKPEKSGDGAGCESEGDGESDGESEGEAGRPSGQTGNDEFACRRQWQTQSRQRTLLPYTPCTRGTKGVKMKHINTYIYYIYIYTYIYIIHYA